MGRSGLVLGGGGARGSYQMGAWSAFRELSLTFDLIVGTSIGALNGALMVAGDFEQADELWSTIECSRIFSEQDEKRIEGVLQITTSLDLLRFAVGDALPQGSLDGRLLEDLIRQRVSEERVRLSPIDFGLVTVAFPSMRPYMPMKNEIPSGELYRWLMASASCFPIFSPYEIDGARYLDGAYYDNLPVGLAVDQGATRIVSVNLDGIGLERPKAHEIPLDEIRIEPRWDLGAIFNFDKNIFARNRRLGYLDTLKAFEKREGFAYTFFLGELEENCRILGAGIPLLSERLATHGEKPLSRTLSALAQEDALAALAVGSWAQDAPTLLCRAAELAGAVFELPPDHCYRFSEFNRLLLHEFEKRPRFFSLSVDPKSLLAEISGAAQPRSIAAFITQSLARPGAEEKSITALLPPREYTAACYLKLLLEAGG